MSEIPESRVKEVLATYTSIRKKTGSRYLKPQQNPEFPGWSAIAVTKYLTLKKHVGFPLTIEKMRDACGKIDASGKNLKRFYDDLHMFLILMENQPDLKTIEGFDDLRDLVTNRYNSRREEDDKKIRKLTNQQQEAWLDMPDVIFRTQMSILYATVPDGALEQSYDHLTTEVIEQYFICAFHILEALPRRHEELSYLEWKKDDDEPRCNYIENLAEGKIVINRHKTSGYNPSCLSGFKMSLTSSLPLLRELRRRAAPDAKYVLPDCYRRSTKTMKYTEAFHLATGRNISMNTLRHICATALTKSHLNTRRNADRFIQYHMGHNMQTQSKYYIHHEKLEDRHPALESCDEINSDDEECTSVQTDVDTLDEECNVAENDEDSVHDVNVEADQPTVLPVDVKPESTEAVLPVHVDLDTDESTVREETQVIDTSDSHPALESKDTEPVKNQRRVRYLPNPVEIATLTQLGLRWKPKLIKGERMSIQSLLHDTEIIAMNGETASHNLSTFGGADLTESQRIEKLRNYVRTSEAFQPDNKLQNHKARVRAAAAKQRR